MHCASLGEFEQGRPVLEACRREFPDYAIALTFFSPSGYEVRKHWEGADAVWYLPADLPGNGQRFAELVKPSLGLIVKYDIWPGIIEAMAEAKVPMILFAALFRKQQIYFQRWGNYFRKALDGFTHILVQSPQSINLLKASGINSNVAFAPDTRFDRVVEVAEKAEKIEGLDDWTADSEVLVAGSTWKSDEVHLRLIWDTVLEKQHWKLLLAPHDIHAERIKEVSDRFPEAALYSNGIPANSKIVILDTMGMLATTYRYAKMAYIGGGFDKGIHNTLEAAVYGIPVLFGPRYHKFREAHLLLQADAAVTASTGSDLLQAVQFLVSNSTNRAEAGKNAAAFVHAHTGGTHAVMELIRQLLEDSK